MNEAAAKRTVAKNTVALLVLRVLLPAFSVVLVMFLARLLGTEGLGRYTLAYTFLYVFSTIAPLGIKAIITRDGARTPANVGELLGTGLAVSLISATLVMTLMWIAVAAMGYDRETSLAILIVSFIVVPGALTAQLEGAASAIERMEFITISTLADTLIKTAGGVAMLLAGYGLIGVLMVAVFGRIVGGLILLVALQRTSLKVQWHPHRKTVSYLLRRAPTFLMITIFATLYWRIDVFMLSQMRSIDDVGFYGAAWRLLELGMVVPQAVCLAVYPQLAHSAHKNPEHFSKLCRSTTRNLVAISLPIALCTTALTGRILELIYGPKFAVAGSTLAILIWTVVPYAWVRYNACVLLATENQKIDLALNATMTGLNVILNLVLIPAYGYLGAAVATTVSIVIYGLAQSAYIRAMLPKYHAVFQIPAVPVFGAIAAGILAWLLRDVHVIAALAAAALLYVTVLLVGGFLSISELRSLAAGDEAKI